MSFRDAVGIFHEMTAHYPWTKEEMALAIYAEYPRKVGRPVALRAILKAMKKCPFPTLLAKTKAYAAAREEQDPQWTPHPSTFFNQERYNDAPETWAPSLSRPTILPAVELRLLQERIACHVANPESTFCTEEPTQEQRKALKALRERLRAVQDGLINL